MPTLILEGPDGLGKSALAQLLVNEAKRFKLDAELVVPEPSKHYGKYEGALEWAYHFMRTHVDLPDKLTVLDRFPIPSEFVYNDAYSLKPRDPEYQEALVRLSYYPWRFVYINIDRGTLRADIPKQVIETDPMFRGNTTKWLRISDRYLVWRCHNKNSVYDLTWKTNTWWTEETARNLLIWAGVPLKGLLK